MNSNILIITIGYTVLTATLVNNTSVTALKNLLDKESLTIDMVDYNKMEKVGSIGTTIPRNDVHMNTVPGDVILYQGKNLVIYYSTNSYSLTPIGKIEGINQDELKKILGDKSVRVTFSIGNHYYENSPRVVGNKLSAGAIAGIVIACVVVVAGLMIGEFFIVKNMLKNKNSISANED